MEAEIDSEDLDKSNRIISEGFGRVRERRPSFRKTGDTVNMHLCAIHLESRVLYK